jgi:hypothetical protein
LKYWVIGGGYNYTQESGTGDRLINREGLDSLISVFRESAFAYYHLKCTTNYH